ncbi:MAG: DUF3000 domain-containing protein [Propionibacteriaceae bacterium]|jgi:hypothetical protein|nr:DUF3000 domain-containing protein [Propionibacteriaceae bacterium]
MGERDLKGRFFDRIARAVELFAWEPGISVEVHPGPTRIAPYSLAVEATLDADGTAATGRLVLLYDPAGGAGWDGTFRCVSMVNAPVDIETATDPLLHEVGWTWFTDALVGCQATYREPAGTVTAVTGRGFGAKAAEDRAEIELRTSWTPVLKGELDIEAHLRAWEELLYLASGTPELAG